MNRLVLILLSVPLCSAGCFYTDPINQRPSVAIHRITPVDGVQLYRTDMLVLDAIGEDPDGDSIAYQWRAYACTGLACDPAEYDNGVDTEFSTTAPRRRSDGVTAPDTVHITLEAHDNLGATAKPSQSLDITLDDHPPTLELSPAYRSSYVVDNDVPVFAKVGDPDDDLATLTLGAWTAYSPAIANTLTLTEDVDAVQTDSDHLQVGKMFHPTAIGDWTIDLVATDPHGATNEQMLPIHVSADHPPCLGQWDPTATTVPNTTIPITDPTLFQVLVVNDDLDPYPSSITGGTEFHWSIVPPGGTRQQLTSVTGAGVALDPDSYTPGDLVELRVEIQDRMHTPVNCPDTDLTCSVISDQTCLQRLTWRVEVR